MDMYERMKMEGVEPVSLPREDLRPDVTLLVFDGDGPTKVREPHVDRGGITSYGTVLGNSRTGIAIRWPARSGWGGIGADRVYVAVETDVFIVLKDYLQPNGVRAIIAQRLVRWDKDTMKDHRAYQ